jgi:phosphoenolpyruvate carboxykinase (ATP)
MNRTSSAGTDLYTAHLRELGITVEDVRRNLAVSQLYEEAIRLDQGSQLAARGALVAYSGQKTGRSPKDKRVIRREPSARDIWWGPINVPLEPAVFAINRERAVDFLNTRPRLYCVDGFAGWDPAHRLKVRVICARPYHALFMHIMLIRPTREELASFGRPDFVILNAGQFPANRHTAGMTSKTSIDIDFEQGEVVILGTEYAGEMKKAVFTLMNYLMPKVGILSMHCSATAEKNSDRSSVLFGLSGTGKTTLSADPKRALIGDDEHCWSDQGIFNIEGGCYAKAIDLTPASEPEIFQALRFGAVLENVVVNASDRHVDFHDARITQNTRGAYPIEFIGNARIPCLAGHPTDVIFLTCDAFGVLPPVSRLTPAQAMYHFISGYTARVAGTEVDVVEPEAVFSPCYGGPFLVWHPAKYADLLATKMKRHDTSAWLVNTGWSGGAYGTGKRMPLALTRAVINAIHNGALRDAPTARDSFFGLDAVAECPQVPRELLLPRATWADKEAYDATARKLAGLFRDNFQKYEAGVSADVRASLV